MTSQRTDNFAAGIKKGSSAYDSRCSMLHAQCSQARNKLETEIKKFHLIKHLPKSHVLGGLAGITPDGGLWVDPNGVYVAAFEGKKQGKYGNAHERWYKNLAIAQSLNINIKYVTFCVGEGVNPKNSLYKGFGFALAREGKDPHAWNILHNTGVSFFGCETGFPQDYIEDIMRQAIIGVHSQ